MQHGLFVLDISQALGLSSQPSTSAELRSWPNPTGSMAFITPPQEFHGQADLTLRDAQGRILRAWSARVLGTALAIDLRGVEDGNYLVELRNADQRCIARVIKTNEE
jgi:hypothetical protein